MQNNLRLLLFAILTGGLSLSVACGDLSEDCDPEVDGADCVCTLDEDDTEVDDCIEGETADGGACTCTLLGDPEPDANNPQPEPDPQEPEAEPPAPAFRFVLVEDTTQNPSGDFPGADVDAISVVKASGVEFFATTFEDDTDISCDGSLACDPNGLLGAPDAIDPDTGFCFGLENPRGPDVVAEEFTALNGGHVIVQFSSVENGDVDIENGDDIHVYEVGATECGGSFDDDPFTVSVSVSDDFGSFQEIGTGGEGSNIVPVVGL